MKAKILFADIADLMLQLGFDYDESDSSYNKKLGHCVIAIRDSYNIDRQGGLLPRATRSAITVDVSSVRNSAHHGGLSEVLLPPAEDESFAISRLYMTIRAAESLCRFVNRHTTTSGEYKD